MLSRNNVNHYMIFLFFSPFIIVLYYLGIYQFNYLVEILVARKSSIYWYLERFKVLLFIDINTLVKKGCYIEIRYWNLIIIINIYCNFFLTLPKITVNQIGGWAYVSGDRKIFKQWHNMTYQIGKLKTMLLFFYCHRNRIKNLRKWQNHRNK